MVDYRTCVVCKNKGKFHNSAVSLYKFPISPRRRKLWISSLNLEEPLKTTARVCEIHFKKEDINRIRLKASAVPILPPITRKPLQPLFSNFVNILPKSAQS